MGHAAESRSPAPPVSGREGTAASYVAAVDTLIAEDLLLLVHDETRGRFRGRWPRHLTLAGAVLVDLALRDAVTAEPPGRVWRTTGRTGDAVLDRALDIIDALPGTAADLLAPLGDGLETTLLRRMEDSGLLEPHVLRLFGRRLFSTWTMPDKSRRLVVRDDVVRAILSDADPQVRTGSLIALLDLLDDVVPQLDRRTGRPGDLQKRAHARARGDWGDGPVREALDASRKAVQAFWASGVVAG